jgi:hypothetical protein
LNLASIAKVCDTDILTIESIFKEIIIQLKLAIQKGYNIRLMFKVGKLLIKNGTISWKNNLEDGLDTKS